MYNLNLCDVIGKHAFGAIWYRITNCARLWGKVFLLLMLSLVACSSLVELGVSCSFLFAAITGHGRREEKP